VDGAHQSQARDPAVTLTTTKDRVQILVPSFRFSVTAVELPADCRLISLSVSLPTSRQRCRPPAEYFALDNSASAHVRPRPELHLRSGPVRSSHRQDDHHHHGTSEADLPHRSPPGQPNNLPERLNPRILEAKGRGAVHPAFWSAVFA
jgi:hypothetical protein